MNSKNIGLDRLKNRVIRYWITGHTGEECEYGRLLGWDKYGILLGVTDYPEKKSILDGAKFVPWSLLGTYLDHWEDDQKENV